MGVRGTLGGLLLLALVVAACGDDDAGVSADGAGTTETTAAAAAPDGFDAEEDDGLGVHRLTMADPDEGEAVYDELKDVDGWIASYDYSGAETTLTFIPYPDDIDTARENQSSIIEGLALHGDVATEPYVVVIADFTAASGSPLDVDARTASDVFDDLVGCDWDGSALHLEHRWYCEQDLDPSVAAAARAVFAEQAGIDPSEVTLTRYR